MRLSPHTAQAVRPPIFNLQKILLGWLCITMCLLYLGFKLNSYASHFDDISYGVVGWYSLTNCLLDFFEKSRESFHSMQCYRTLEIVHFPGEFLWESLLRDLLLVHRTLTIVPAYIYHLSRCFLSKNRVIFCQSI